MKLRIFTDGACSGNPGKGGWACIINLKDKVIKSGGCEEYTTNNRMELKAVYEAVKFIAKNIEKLKRVGYDSLEIHSDSAYVVNALTKGWTENWLQNDWKTKSGEDVKNKDLWANLITLNNMLSFDFDIDFVKVKGHSGNYFNELADEYAREMLKSL